MKVTLGLILSHGFPVPAPFVVGLTDLLRMLLTGQGNGRCPPDRQVTDARILISHAFPTDTARNELVEMFLRDDDGDSLLFLDTDMRHCNDLVHRLVAHSKDVVSGLYVMRRPPYHTVAMRKTGSGPTDYQAVNKLGPVSGLMPIDAAGAGALLISRRCLEAVGEQTGRDWFRYQDGPAGKRTRSEDMWFFEQAKACGFQAYLDADAVCTHVAQAEAGPQDHEPYAHAYRRALAAQIEQVGA